MSRSWDFSRAKELTVSICTLLSVIALLILHTKLVWEEQRSHAISYTAENPFEPSSLQKVKRLPQVIIIGARKSGTRALLKFLELNPSVKGAKSEVHFFDKLQNYKLGLDWYRGKMPETLPGELTIEKSPAYFVTRESPERIKAMNSSIKLILILRSPVVRLISDFSQLVANKIEHANGLTTGHEYDDESYYYDSSALSTANGTLDDGIWQDAEKKFEDFVLRPDGGIDEQRLPVRIGMYSMHLERWLAHFPRRNIHIVDGEKLISDPFEEIRKIELFLKLKPTIERTDFVFNPHKGFYCISKKWSSTGQYSNRTKRMTEELRQNNTSGSICLSKSKGRRHVFVKKELMEALSSFYEPFDFYLQSLTNIQLSWINKH